EAEKELGVNASEQQREALAQGLQDQLDDLDRTLVEELKSYKDFFDNISELSGTRLNVGAAALEKDLDDLIKKYPELKKFADVIRKQIGEAKTAKTAEDFRNMADSLSFMADSLSDIDSGF